jgi:CheY-like chemotaxis protein
MLARHREDGAGESPSGPGRSPDPDQDAPARETVLLVEDNEGLRLLARLALEPYGYAVLAAGDGDQALEIGRQYLGPIHILVTDIQVPGMRGPELAERIASLRPGIKVLFTSGGLAVHENLPAKAALLDKPFSIEALARRVRQLLDS